MLALYLCTAALNLIYCLILMYFHVNKSTRKLDIWDAIIAFCLTIVGPFGTIFLIIVTIVLFIETWNDNNKMPNGKE